MGHRRRVSLSCDREEVDLLASRPNPPPLNDKL